MAQNIYDDPGFFAGYSLLSRSIHGFDGAAEWPAIRALLPDLNNMRIVDLGCGFGWFARWAKEHGAARVLGLDLSENMIGRAKAETRNQDIHYSISDLDRVELSEASFDFAYSSLALHYVEDFYRLTKTIHRALVPDAQFVFTIEHPIYMAPSNPGWSVDKDGRKTWPVSRYAVEGPRTTNWLAKGVVKYHRTVGTTINTLIGVGFTIRHVQEWAPTADQITENLNLAEEVERPMLLIVSAKR
jgi:ubiquinone/menaquinone biosynthesis C-methylase UbiE